MTEIIKAFLSLIEVTDILTPEYKEGEKEAYDRLLKFAEHGLERSRNGNYSK